MQKGGVIMERRKSILFGILGGVFLALLNPNTNGLLNLYWSLDILLGLPFIYLAIELLFRILSAIGVVAIAFFSLLLIIDGIKQILKEL